MILIWKTAMLIGCFQCLSLIPGTSRSGSTILGAIILGVGRAAGGRVLLLPCHPHDAWRKRTEACEIPAFRRFRNRRGVGDSGGRLRGFLRGQPACHQGADGICTQAQLCGIRRVPHHSGGTGSGIFCLPNPARIKIT